MEFPDGYLFPGAAYDVFTIFIEGVKKAIKAYLELSVREGGSEILERSPDYDLE